MLGRHRKHSLLRTVTRTGSLVAAAASTGLGVILAGGASQAATILPAHPAATSHTTTWRHLAHLAHLARMGQHFQSPAHLNAVYTGSAGGSFQSCVIARESGGNSQVMNSTGHYGLYQFSASTWAAYGGSPAAFGNASVAEQNQVFANAIAAGGRSNWSPYDGC